MSDSRRLEMEKFGVGGSIVEPGQFDEATAINLHAVVISIFIFILLLLLLYSFFWGGKKHYTVESV